MVFLCFQTYNFFHCIYTLKHKKLVFDKLSIPESKSFLIFYIPPLESESVFGVPKMDFFQKNTLIKIPIISRFLKAVISNHSKKFEIDSHSRKRSLYGGDKFLKNYLNPKCFDIHCFGDI